MNLSSAHSFFLQANQTHFETEAQGNSEMAYYNEYIGEDIRKDEIQDYRNIVRVKAQQCTIKPFFTNMAHQLTLT